ncbi:hypothetical protein K0M31_016962 [Melipona bicolor]|uniref:Uncharacterized protein n=1 Tax=Melipona bicolor TaxID=60889 RepID=A0AA40FEP4_9HYME|nr:hypothetical protein K0M31_016962 [Melipona bicolor]
MTNKRNTCQCDVASNLHIALCPRRYRIHEKAEPGAGRSRRRLGGQARILSGPFRLKSNRDRLLISDELPFRQAAFIAASSIIVGALTGVIAASGNSFSFGRHLPLGQEVAGSGTDTARRKRSVPSITKSSRGFTVAFAGIESNAKDHPELFVCTNDYLKFTFPLRPRLGNSESSQDILIDPLLRVKVGFLLTSDASATSEKQKRVLPF